MWGKSSAKKQGGMAVMVSSNRIDLASVTLLQGGRPRVDRLESYARDGDVASVLTTLRRQKGLGGYQCSTLVPQKDYQLLQLEAPDVPAAELKEAVRWKLADFVDFPVEAATLDLLEIPQPDGSSRAKQLFVVVAKNETLAPVIQAFQEAKLNLGIIDIPEMAQRNVATLFEEENRGVGFLNFDEEGGLLTFVFQGELYASRRVDVTVTQLAQADEERRQQLYERIGLELQRSLDNFERLYGFITVSRVLLGPCSHVPGLLDYLKDFVFVPVEMADLGQVMDFDAAPELANPSLQGLRLTLLGAALRRDVA